LKQALLINGISEEEKKKINQMITLLQTNKASSSNIEDIESQLKEIKSRKRKIESDILSSKIGFVNQCILTPSDTVDNFNLTLTKQLDEASKYQTYFGEARSFMHTAENKLYTDLKISNAEGEFIFNPNTVSGGYINKIFRKSNKKHTKHIKKIKSLKGDMKGGAQLSSQSELNELNESIGSKISIINTGNEITIKSGNNELKINFVPRKYQVKSGISTTDSVFAVTSIKLDNFIEFDNKLNKFEKKFYETSTIYKPIHDKRIEKNDLTYQQLLIEYLNMKINKIYRSESNRQILEKELKREFNQLYFLYQTDSLDYNFDDLDDLEQIKNFSIDRVFNKLNKDLEKIELIFNLNPLSNQNFSKKIY
jgi:hypothetical protein